MTTSNTGHGDVLTAFQHAAIGYAQDPSQHTERRMNEARAALQAALSSASSGAGVLTDEVITAVWIEHGLDECDPHGFARAILAATQRAEPVAQSGVVGLREALERIDGFTMSQFMGPHDMALECVNTARAALNAAPAAEADPVGWTYELATRKAWAPTEHYTGWEWRLSKEKPNMPEGSIRNLRPLVYGDTRPAAPLSEEVIEAIGLCVRDVMNAPGMNSITTPDYAVRVAAWLDGATLAHSPSPQSTDEATDAEHRAELALCQGIIKGLTAERDALAAQLATPPDNAAGREGVK